MLLDAPGIVDSTKAAMADLPEVVKDLIRILHSKQSLKFVSKAIYLWKN